MGQGHVNSDMAITITVGMHRVVNGQHEWSRDRSRDQHVTCHEVTCQVADVYFLFMSQNFDPVPFLASPC